MSEKKTEISLGRALPIQQIGGVLQLAGKMRVLRANEEMIVVENEAGKTFIEPMPDFGGGAKYEIHTIGNDNSRFLNFTDQQHRLVLACLDGLCNAINTVSEAAEKQTPGFENLTSTDDIDELSYQELMAYFNRIKPQTQAEKSKDHDATDTSGNSKDAEKKQPAKLMLGVAFFGLGGLFLLGVGATWMGLLSLSLAVWQGLQLYGQKSE